MESDLFVLDWNDAQDLCRHRLAGTVARLTDAREREDADLTRDLCRQLEQGSQDLRAFLDPAA